MTTSSSTYSDAQVCMTLAQMAYNMGGGSISEILNALPGLLDGKYATQGQWQLADWQISTDSILGTENFMFLAYNSTEDRYALSIRGTVSGELRNLIEDLDVFARSDWKYGGSDVQIAQGAALGLDTLISLESDSGQTLEQYLSGLSDDPIDLLVTGHSLGGALCAVMSAYLAEQLGDQVNLTGYSFASPTVGVTGWANYFADTVPDFYRYWNKNDLVPHFWDRFDLGLIIAESIPCSLPAYMEFGVIPGLLATFDKEGFAYEHEGISKEIGPGQPNCSQSYWTNAADQHNGNNYLALLQAPQVTIVYANSSAEPVLQV